MGSDNLCDATGLPITNGDAVVGFAVSTQPIKYGGYADSPWANHIPISFAFRGTYDEDIKFTNPQGCVALEVLGKEGKALGLQADDLDRLVDELSIGGFVVNKFKDYQKNEVESLYQIYMVRADVFEFLTDDKDIEPMYDDYDTGFRERAREDGQAFLKHLDQIFDNPEERFDLFPETIDDDPSFRDRMIARKKESEERFKDMGGFLGTKLFSDVGAPTVGDRKRNLFVDLFRGGQGARAKVGDALYDYRTWLIDSYQEGRRSNDAQFKQFIEDAIDFTVFDANLAKLGLSWTPKGRGRDQFKTKEPFVEFFQFCLDKAKEFNN